MRETHSRPPAAAWQRIAAVAVCISTALSGCGTVFYGRTQQISLRSTPPGAAASLATVEATTPGDIALPRNQPGGWAVFRAAAPGYQPACTVVGGRFNGTYLVMDGIFLLALPMLIDLIALGSINALRQYPQVVSLTLQPLDADEEAQPLPSDAEIIHFRRLTWVDLCQPSALKSASASATQCASDDTRIEAADGDETKVWWTFFCDEERFRCSSDRRLTKVTCAASGS